MNYFWIGGIVLAISFGFYYNNLLYKQKQKHLSKTYPYPTPQRTWTNNN
jgi:hypothetical protein